MPRVIFHLDMDAFYASVEQRDHPELRGKPVIVGAPPDRRGVVCAASYEARPFGVRSAMPSRTAARLCPEGIFVRPRMEAYRDESHRIMEILASVDEVAIVEQVSVDEAYLDLSPRFEGSGMGHDEALAAALPIARKMKERIREERGLAATIGVGGNKLIAKIASDSGKPDGLLLVPEREKAAFLRPLKAGVLHGVGRATAEVLESSGLRTVGDIQDYVTEAPGDLRALVGSYAATLAAYAFGEDDRPLDRETLMRSIGSETTFERDSDDRPLLRRTLREQAEEIAGSLANEAMAAKTVQVKIRYGDFTTLTRQLSLPDPIAEAGELYRIACLILAKHRLVNRPLRLLGLAVSGLVPPSTQAVFPFMQREKPAS
ncbi:DNA polymerase-4 [Verrucomicrobium sp. GAS474]|uniref:DNA polymerase IV n=1 Tax=Verrucomicrobium sp. GAS474 TaxID=1882831 RepID=UPI00087A84FA|nr:DNA polymerase IV [Verrucomicrobium sp. GAS474]SDT85916.1 DNA polymerase-4 [Verrucomicrobium sp. GAS474]